MQTKTFSYLVSLTKELKKRYNNLFVSHLYASNSFYDAIGNLMEEYFKYIAYINYIDIEKGSSHGKLIINLNDFFEICSVDNRTLKNIRNISRNINSHKHSQNLSITIKDSLFYFSNFFNLYERISKKENKKFNEKFEYGFFEKTHGLLSIERLINIANIIEEKNYETNSVTKSLDDDFIKQISLLKDLILEG